MEILLLDTALGSRDLFAEQSLCLLVSLWWDCCVAVLRTDLVLSTDSRSQEKQGSLSR